MNNYEPTIVTFLCNWCSYAGADTAGGARKEYPANIRIIKVMCSGRVEPSWVLDALKQGADGVLVLGCHPGDCHYKKGNYKAERRYNTLKKMLNEIGIEEDRVKLDWVGASEGDKFVEITKDMVERIKALGPIKHKAM
ncbi:MAG: hydrogenase iron-sulfur subunit [Candidatus Delongbacteria bacterium]|nr:hydrogenase iron-sulfur subunit [Candidatus Delongbacteria bacterium]